MNLRGSAGLAAVADDKAIAFLRKKIVNWARRHGRAYPWRSTHDPFKVLMAEMMLRRTKGDQVKPVYEQLFREFPDLDAVAGAEDEKLQRMLSPLGLRWRLPAFAQVAREVKEKYGSKVPDKREELTDLPGVGDYVAGAVLSVAYGKKEWIVDSNIVRVFKRYFGMQTSEEGRRDRHVIETSKKYCSTKDPRRANLAILDFAATVCLPRKPRCGICPLAANCSYYKAHSLGRPAVPSPITSLTPHASS
jgi:A/G-specific adenine glycosylase